MSNETPRNAEQAMEVPLVEQLLSVPVHFREFREVGRFHSRNIPYGRMCNDAADRIQSLERELAAAVRERDEARKALREAMEQLKHSASVKAWNEMQLDGRWPCWQYALGEGK